MHHAVEYGLQQDMYTWQPLLNQVDMVDEQNLEERFEIYC